MIGSWIPFASSCRLLVNAVSLGEHNLTTILYRVVINANVPYIKMVSEQFDICHGTLLQYVDFLCSAVTPTSAYAQLIPPLEDLVHLYHLDPEVSLSLSLSLSLSSPLY